MAGTRPTGIHISSRQARRQPRSRHLIPEDHIAAVRKLGTTHPAAPLKLFLIIKVIVALKTGHVSSRGRGQITEAGQAEEVAGAAAVVSAAFMALVLAVLPFAHAVVVATSVFAGMTVTTMLPVFMTVATVLGGRGAGARGRVTR